MEYRFLLDLAIILISTKIFGLITKRIGLPQVVGAIIAGLVIGPMALNIVKPAVPAGSGSIMQDPIKVIAEIGVIMILFSAGMSTNLREMKKNGVASIVITILGVVVPFILGFLVSALYFNNWSFNFEPLFQNRKLVLKAVFVGTVLTATSVGITVETLSELGRLNGKVGYSIMGAAIIDDIIGIVILSVVTGIAAPMTTGAVTVNAGKIFGQVMLKIFLFFLTACVIGIIIHYIFKFFGKRFDHKRRLPILSLAICFLFAYASEHFFGIADIAGAFIAGIFIANLRGTEYVEKRIDTISYLIFSPVFFARIGINADLSGFNKQILGFTALFVLVGILSKFIGCYGAARMCRFTRYESVAVGTGMIVRGEVALVVASKGQEIGLFDDSMLPGLMILIIASSLIAPIILKAAFRSIDNKTHSKTRSVSEESMIIGLPMVEYEENPTGVETSKLLDKFSEYTTNKPFGDHDDYHTIEI